jgi:hypothetical protein
LDDLSQTQKQFGDLLITELQCAEITHLQQLEDLVVGVYQRRPAATVDIWIRELTLANQGLESMALADQMETYFDLDVAIQVIGLLVGCWTNTKGKKLIWKGLMIIMCTI